MREPIGCGEKDGARDAPEGGGRERAMFESWNGSVSGAIGRRGTRNRSWSLGCEKERWARPVLGATIPQ